MRRILFKLLRHSHNEAIGEVKEHNPWIEDVWRLGSLYLVHWQTLKHPSLSSGREPRHIWRLHFLPTTVELIVRYGTAPRDA